MRHLTRLFPLIVFVVFLATTNLRAADDTVTLNSGEIVSGRIVSQTDSNLDIEVSNEHHTIFTTRTIDKADIKEIHQLTPAQRQESEMYEALARYQLNPNQEFTSAYYAQAMAAFDKFLAAYPNSEYTAKIAAKRADWRFEKFEVEHGRAKFGGTWMTPERKKPLVEEFQRQQAERLRTQQRQQLEGALQSQVQIVRAARARVDAAQKEHNFLHNHANDEELAQAPAALNAAMKKFNELNTAYRNAGGTVNFQQQIDGK
jgi:hypothetical protein